MPFTNCISRINNTRVDDVHDIDLVIQMYNLIEYSLNYSKTSGIDNGAIVDFTVANSVTVFFLN